MGNRRSQTGKQAQQTSAGRKLEQTLPIKVPLSGGHALSPASQALDAGGIGGHGSGQGSSLQHRPTPKKLAARDICRPHSRQLTS